MFVRARYTATSCLAACLLTMAGCDADGDQDGASESEVSETQGAPVSSEDGGVRLPKPIATDLNKAR